MIQFNFSPNEVNSQKLFQNKIILFIFFSERNFIKPISVSRNRFLKSVDDVINKLIYLNSS